MNSLSIRSWALWLLLAAGGLGLITVANLPQSSVQASPVIQVTATCAPQSTPTPVSSCPSNNPDPVLGRQPHPTEMVATFIDAGLNRLGNQGPSLPQIWQGTETEARKISPYVPCILLEAIAYTESTGWKQFNAPDGECGFTKMGIDPTPVPSGSSTCGYGVMQITSGMSGGSGFDPNRVVAEYPYNIGTGARILVDKWNGLQHVVGENNPYIVEDWYYAVWAYNGFSWRNNPRNRDRYNVDRGTWSCGTDPNQKQADFPYQELIWGCAANSPGGDYWQADQLSLPADDDVYTGEFQPPSIHLPRPLPAHGSCSAGYLPVIRKSPASTPTPTPKPAGCYEGRVLLEDGFEDGDPFTAPGTGTAGAWERLVFDGYPHLPQKAGLDEFDNPIARR